MSANAIQSFAFSNPPTGGLLNILVGNSIIALDPTADDPTNQALIDAVLGAGNTVFTSGGWTTAVTIEFTGAYARIPIPLLGWSSTLVAVGTGGITFDGTSGQVTGLGDLDLARGLTATVSLTNYASSYGMLLVSDNVLGLYFEIHSTGAMGAGSPNNPQALSSLVVPNDGLPHDLTFYLDGTNAIFTLDGGTPDVQPLLTAGIGGGGPYAMGGTTQFGGLYFPGTIFSMNVYDGDPNGAGALIASYPLTAGTGTVVEDTTDGHSGTLQPGATWAGSSSNVVQTTSQAGVNVAAADVRFGTPVGSATGTCHVPTAADTIHPVPVDNTIGNFYAPTASNVDSLTTFGVGNAVAGADIAGALATNQVKSGVAYGPAGGQTGTYTGGGGGSGTALIVAPSILRRR